jgi:hypothetical protein
MYDHKPYMYKDADSSTIRNSTLADADRADALTCCCCGALGDFGVFIAFSSGRLLVLSDHTFPNA